MRRPYLEIPARPRHLDAPLGRGLEIYVWHSDDCFEYFRAWLISRGKAVFDGAVWRSADLPATVQSAKYPELGPDWDFDDVDEMARRYPKLSKRVRDR